MLTVSFDRDARALYVRFREGAVVRSETVDEGTLVDLDERGDVVGVEVIVPDRNWPVDEVAKLLSSADDEALRQVYERRAVFAEGRTLAAC